VLLLVICDRLNIEHCLKEVGLEAGGRCEDKDDWHNSVCCIRTVNLFGVQIPTPADLRLAYTPVITRDPTIVFHS
jgi:hypothetical protein